MFSIFTKNYIGASCIDTAKKYKMDLLLLLILITEQGGRCSKVVMSVELDASS